MVAAVAKAFDLQLLTIGKQRYKIAFNHPRKAPQPVQ